MNWLAGVATLACVPLAIWLAWLSDHHRVHSTAICMRCHRLRMVDREGRCHHCYEHDGGLC